MFEEFRALGFFFSNTASIWRVFSGINLWVLDQFNRDG